MKNQSLSEKLLSQHTMEPMSSAQSASKIDIKAQFHSGKLVQQLQEAIFAHIDAPYSVHNIPITEFECIHTVLIPSKKEDNKLNIYLSHGFGGTSLMYFPVIDFLRQYGNVVLWEIRGMGVAEKLRQYRVQNSKITDFYVKPIEQMLDYFDHKRIIMINHSFSSYLCLRYLLDNQSQNRILKLILLSPVGITPKQRDLKNQIKSCSDIWQTLLGKFGWKFNLTYKSPLRTICSCMKQKILKNSFQSFPLTSEELDLMVRVFLTLISLPDGSENVFFNYFEPRVIPKQPIQPLMQEARMKQKIDIYFGQQDWADRLSANELSNSHENISVTVLQKCGHMIPLHLDEVQQAVRSGLEEYLE